MYYHIVVLGNAMLPWSSSIKSPKAIASPEVRKLERCIFGGWLFWPGSENGPQANAWLHHVTLFAAVFPAK